MHNSAQHTITVPAAGFCQGQYVLYRDPEKFWTGQAGHTFVCRVDRVNLHNTYYLTPLVSGYPIPFASPDYMRLLPPLDAMRDIDTAPLRSADDMTAAAMAWLTQQPTTANTPPELPGARG